MSAARVLVVDDNAMNVELVRAVLQADAFEVRAAGDALAATDIIRDFKPDIILMDVQLPGMDGLELTRHIKAGASTRHIAVVAFTAYAMQGDEERMLAAGCDGYVSKPIDVSTFAARIRGFLRAVI